MCKRAPVLAASMLSITSRDDLEDPHEQVRVSGKIRRESDGRQHAREP
jgi:hypothetical protein